MLLNCFIFHFQTMFDNSFWRENIKFNQNSYLKKWHTLRTDPNWAESITVQLTKLNRLFDCVILMKSLLVNDNLYVSVFFVSFRLLFKWEFDWRRNFIGNCENVNRIRAISFTICSFDLNISFCQSSRCRCCYCCFIGII